MKVKDVVVDKTRYIVCHDEEQAKKDQADRMAMVESRKSIMEHRPVYHKCDETIINARTASTPLP